MCLNYCFNVIITRVQQFYSIMTFDNTILKHTITVYKFKTKIKINFLILTFPEFLSLTSRLKWMSLTGNQALYIISKNTCNTMKDTLLQCINVTHLRVITYPERKSVIFPFKIEFSVKTLKGIISNMHS